MSLHKWFSKESGSNDNGAFKAAEKAVQAIESQQKGKKRKSSESHCYDQATKTAIGTNHVWLSQQEVCLIRG